MLNYLIAAMVLAPVLALVTGAVTGRVRVRACCAPADPARDLRMRDAFTEDDEADSHPVVRRGRHQRRSPLVGDTS